MTPPEVVNSGEITVALLVITGASGLMGSLVRPLLLARGHRLRLVGRSAPADPGPGEFAQAANGTDLDAMRAVLHGADAVVHLSGISTEAPWSEILQANVRATQTLLEAARIERVSRVLLASSIHAAGMTPIDRLDEAPVLPPAPDGYYGVSKVAMEALGAMFAARYGMSVVSARIGTVKPAPDSVRCLATWASPGDCARLIEAVVALAQPGHWIVWGVSDNTRGWFDLSEGHRIGYAPQDDAEEHAERVLAEAEAAELAPARRGESSDPDAGIDLLGAAFTVRPPGVRW